jgi:peptidoglycan hydrolase-like protein with peptidoglycan-binding domain
MAGPSKSDYIRWVKGSLNRLLGASLADDGNMFPDYRSWLITFQMKHKLAVHAKVDRPTQDALIKANRKHAGYVRWIQTALLISGEGIKAKGKPIVADGSWGPHTEQAVKDFQAMHEKVKADGWVGANTERLLMLRTGTVPPGRTKVLRDPKPDPVVPIWDIPVPDEPIPELIEFGYRFKTSEGVSISLSKGGVTAGVLHLEETSNRTVMKLNYAAIGVGLSPIPAAADLSTTDMPSMGTIIRNRLYGRDALTLNDITGFCLIYQGVFVSGVNPGGYGTIMLLSVGAGLVYAYGATVLTGGYGVVAVPAIVASSCHSMVGMIGINNGSPNVGISGAIGYLGFGDVREKIDKLKGLVDA